MLLSRDPEHPLTLGDASGAQVRPSIVDLELAVN